MRAPSVRAWGWGLIGWLGAVGGSLFAADTNPPPRLTIASAGGSGLVLSWPVSAAGFRLERAPELPPPGGWTEVSTPVTVVGGTNYLTQTRPATMQFYRLRRVVDLPALMLEYGSKLAEGLAVRGGLEDVYPDIPFLDRLDPRRFTPLQGLPTGLAGESPGLPGLSEVRLEGYCLKVGTPAPGFGDGYLPMPFRGPRADIVARLVDSAVLAPAATQEMRQILIWAVLLRTRLSSLPPAVQDLAAAILSASDLQRLEAAAAEKEALEAGYKERFLDAYFGPGGLFADLPASMKDILNRDNAFEEALANSMAMSYEEVQNLAFLAAAGPQPIEPVREIPYGRWAWVPTSAEPPAGYFARYLPDTYQVVQVHLYRAEGLTVSEDAVGRIKSIEDAVGNRIEVAYDDGIAALEFSGDGGVKGYALSTVRWVGPPDWDDPRKLPVDVRTGAGWVLCGVPAVGGGGVVVPGGSARYREAGGRYEWTLAHRVELQRLEAEFTRVHPQRRPGDALTLGRLIRLASFCEGLRLAMLEAVPEEDPEFPLLRDRLGLGYRAWASVLAGLGVGAQPAPAPAGVRLFGSGVPDIRWKTPEANAIYEQLTSQLKANGSAQDLAVSRAKEMAARADARAAWLEYQKWSGRTVDAMGRVHNVAGVGTPWQVPLRLFLPILDGTVNLWLMAGMALATADPPRDDYTTLVPVPVPVLDPGLVEGGAGISAERLAAARALLPAALRLGAQLHACVVTYDRVGGALRAGDQVWAARQAAAFAGLEREVGQGMLDAADALETWLAVLGGEGVEDLLVTVQDVRVVREQLRTTGYAADQVAAFRQLGLSDGDIERCRQASLAAPLPDEDFGAIGSLGSMPGVFREMGRRLMEIAVVRAPVGP